MLNYVRQCFKVRVVFHTLYLLNAFLTQLTHYLIACVAEATYRGYFSERSKENGKKILATGKFMRERP